MITSILVSTGWIVIAFSIFSIIAFVLFCAYIGAKLERKLGSDFHPYGDA